LGFEERIEDILKALQKWESERLRTVQTGMSEARQLLMWFNT
jgi:hypothetical protein